MRLDRESLLDLYFDGSQKKNKGNWESALASFYLFQRYGKYSHETTALICAQDGCSSDTVYQRRDAWALYDLIRGIRLKSYPKMTARTLRRSLSYSHFQRVYGEYRRLVPLWELRDMCRAAWDVGVPDFEKKRIFREAVDTLRRERAFELLCMAAQPNAKLSVEKMISVLGRDPQKRVERDYAMIVRLYEDSEGLHLSPRIRRALLLLSGRIKQEKASE